MTNIKISSNGQIGQIDFKDVTPGNEILIENEGIIEPAIVLCDKLKCLNQTETKPVNFVRVFDDNDIMTKKSLKKKAQEYVLEAHNKVFRHSLSMKILDADLSFDEKKLTFYFSAENRVDFRSMVSDMVGDFGKIIRLQQVGARDEAKRFGGFGRCGRPLCCATFLNNLDEITLEMAENQSITNLKSPKLAGCCGKPMCCISYERQLKGAVSDYEVGVDKKEAAK